MPDLIERATSTDEDDWPEFSYSQTQTWERCTQKWDFIYNRTLMPKIQTSRALNIGLLVHGALEVYYSNKRSVEEVDTYFKQILEKASDKDLHEIGRAFLVVKRYCKEFAPSNDVGHSIVASEAFFKLPRKTLEGFNYYIVGYIDLVTRSQHNGKFKVWDHKTSTTGLRGFWTPQQVQVDSQFILYAACLRELEWDIHGGVLNMLNTYNYANTKEVPLDNLFRRITMIWSPREMTNALVDFEQTVQDIFIRHTSPRRSMEKGCTSCAFAQVCYLERKGMNSQQILDLNFTKREKR